MISILALLMSMAGFLNEMNFAQALTASLGGTMLRYQTTFGLFTFALGLGAWLFERLAWSKNSPRQALLISQALMVLVSVGGTYWITWFNPLKTGDSLGTTALAYLPVILSGLITGFELPALLTFSSQTHKPLSPLAWDYMGMFIASLLFPLYMIYRLGVFHTSWMTGALALLSLVLVKAYLPTDSSPPQEQQTTTAIEQPHPPLVLTYILIFTLSFCSFCYELLSAKIIGDLIQNDTLAYSAGVGIMLVGIGLGTFRAQHTQHPRSTLIKIETGLVLIGTSLFTLTHIVATVVHASPHLQAITQSPWLGLICLAPFPLLIGYLTGYELPCLLKMLPHQNSTNSHGKALAMNYLGALVSGFITPLVFIPYLSPSIALHLVATLNFLVLCLFILWRHKKNIFKIFFAPVLCSLFFVISTTSNTWSEQIYLKTYYYQLQLPEMSLHSLSQYLRLASSIHNVYRESSTYQYIDKVENNNPGHVFHEEGFRLFLNKQQQLDSTSWEKYHQSFAWGALNLQVHPVKNVLICGGGDGLLARVLANIPSIETIQLIELDPRMLEFTTTDWGLQQISANSLHNPKVTSHIGDAYTFAYLSKQKFDAIFLDFPYPDSLDLSRLFSLEFYSALRTRLHPRGFIVLDAPIWRYIDKTSTASRPAYELKIIKDTLEAAGFPTVFSYGPHEPFIYASTEQRRVSFNYELLPEDLSNTTFTNLVSLDYLLRSPYMPNAPMINSVYKPQKFFKYE